MARFLIAQWVCMNNKERQTDHQSDTKVTVKLIFIGENATLSSSEYRNKKWFAAVKVNG